MIRTKVKSRRAEILAFNEISDETFEPEDFSYLNEEEKFSPRFVKVDSGENTVWFDLFDTMALERGAGNADWDSYADDTFFSRYVFKIDSGGEFARVAFQWMTDTPARSRSYPYPGKFESEKIYALHLHTISLHGFVEEECGDVSETGRWYGLVATPDDGFTNAYFKDLDESLEDLTEDELEILNNEDLWILSEDSNGFVSVWSATREEWEEILEEINTLYEETN